MSATPEIFEQTIKVTKDDLDELEHVNNVRYVQWIQDIAKAHWEKRAPEEMKKEFFWVVIRHEVDYKQQAFLEDELLLKTFIGDQTHVTSTRHVTILNLNKETGKVLVEAKSTWCLMNLETKRPFKITPQMLQIFTK